MPGLTTAPNVIEQSDFSAGWEPDFEPAAVPPNGLLSTMNLLPDFGTAVPQVRRGYKRLVPVFKQGYRLESIHPYNRLAGPQRGQYLMLVLTNHLDDTLDNVQLWSLNLSTGEVERVDDGEARLNSDGRHYGLTIDQTFYGGGPNDPMYSWSPLGYKRTPSHQNFPVLKDNADQTNTDTQRAVDFAFEKDDKVLWTDSFSGTEQAYSAAISNRFDQWESGHRYKKGDRVSSLVTDPTSGLTYMKSSEAKLDHTSSSGNKPGSGAGYWIGVGLGFPRDENGDVTEKWNLVPTAPVSNVAEWHANRMWLRADNTSNLGKSILGYSFPLKPKTGGDIGVLVWDPTNWSPTPDDDGDHGGWLPVNTGDGDDITAIKDFGYYLIIAKRRTTWVKAGLDPDTWVVRKLGEAGAIGPRAIAELDGLVYILSDDGLYATDGTQLQEAPGSEKFRDWLREAPTWEKSISTLGDLETNEWVTMWAFGGYIWVSLGTTSETIVSPEQSPTPTAIIPNTVMVYSPKQQSAWLLNMSILAVAKNRVEGVEQVFFSKPTFLGAETDAVVAWTGEPGRSKSTRTINDETETNLWANPSFSVLKGETLTQARDRGGWDTRGKTSFYYSPIAALDGPVGAVVHNTNDSGSDKWAGIGRSFTDGSGDLQTLSCYVRPAAWKTKHATITYDNFHFVVGEDPLPQWRHHFTEVGHGWWRAQAQYVGNPEDNRYHGIEISANGTVHLDKFLAEDQNILRPWFDGDKTDDIDGVSGGGFVTVYQYDHPDVREFPTDDEGGDEWDPRDIGWSLRTAWFPFGTVHEVRRIRRIWALIRNQTTAANPTFVTIRGRRNFSDVPVFEKDTLAENPASFVEGLRMADSFAVNFEVEGVGAPAAVLGVAADTQPRRVSYHHRGTH